MVRALGMFEVTHSICAVLQGLARLARLARSSGASLWRVWRVWASGWTPGHASLALTRLSRKSIGN
eukprot:4359876-Prymnesium_polylepis.1